MPHRPDLMDQNLAAYSALPGPSIDATNNLGVVTLSMESGSGERLAVQISLDAFRGFVNQAARELRRIGEGAK